MGNLEIMLMELVISVLVVACMAANPKPLRLSPKARYLKLSETSKTGAEGGTIQVNCSLTVAKAPLQLRWELSHDVKKRNVQQINVSSTTVGLRITSLKRTNAGSYTCLVIMPGGAEEHAEFSLFVQQAKTEVCPKNQFKCEKTKSCLFIRYRCDNMDDCGDGSDEECDVDPCLNKFRCNNSRCVDHEYVCDHVDHCGDLSDERRNCNVHMIPVPVSPVAPVADDNQYAWLQITVSTFIAAVVGLVLLISFIVIMVFRIRMRRRREQRIALERVYQQGRHLEANASSPGPVNDQRQFLLGPSQAHYGNIIVNVNNGVQYIPGYDYPILMDVPPPYSEVGRRDGESNAPPPPYSTLERQNNTSRAGTTHQHRSPHHGAATQTAQSSEHLSGRQPTSGGRCNVEAVHAQDMGVGSESLSRGACRETQSGVSTGTLPSISVSSQFMQSLLGSYPQQEQLGEVPGVSSSPTSRNNGSEDEAATHRQPVPTHDAAVNSQAEPVHTAFSSRQRADHSSPSTPRSATSPDRSRGEPASPFSTMSDVPDLTASQAGYTASPVSVKDTAEDKMLDAVSGDPYLPSPQAPGQNEVPLAQDSEGEEDEAVCLNEEGTFLLRKPKPNKPQQSSPRGAVPGIPLSVPSTPAGEGKGSSDEASHALLNEVLRRDEQHRPRPGHLSVQGGEIVLHTPTGVLVDPPAGPSHSTAVGDPVSTLQGSPASQELTLHNGALVFGSPNRRTSPTQHASRPSHTNPDSLAGATTAEHLPHHTGNPVASSVSGAHNLDDPESFYPHNPPQTGPDSLQSQEADARDKSDTLHRKELQFKDGELVLESPKHTASTQILSHLKGAYAEQDGLAGAIEPVVNTKRSTGASVVPSKSPKFNSDVVLPQKNHPQ